MKGHDPPRTTPDQSPPRRFPIRLVVALAVLSLAAAGALSYLVSTVRSNTAYRIAGSPALPPARAPSHAFSLPNAVILECYDSPYIGNRLRTLQDDAVVLARNADGTVRWCIYAGEHPHDEVDSVRFSEASENSDGYTVEGIVSWGAGVEWTGWHLSAEGDLKEFYYQW